LILKRHRERRSRGAIQREAHSMSDAAICRAAGAHQLLLIGCIPSKVADLYLDLAKTS
jgi:hypothetical protein